MGNIENEVWRRLTLAPDRSQMPKLILKVRNEALDCMWTCAQRAEAMTIHQHPTTRKPYLLLAEVPMPERAVLMTWLMGMERPPGAGESVYLADYLQFVAQRKGYGRRERAGSP
jgi:hypothetical protein